MSAGKYRCGVCPASFTTYKQVAAHRTGHDPAEFEFLCGLCDRRFSSPQARAAHGGKAHPTVPKPKRLSRAKGAVKGARSVPKTKGFKTAAEQRAASVQAVTWGRDCGRIGPLGPIDPDRVRARAAEGAFNRSELARSA